MIYYTAKTPIEYQTIFHQHLGLHGPRQEGDYRIWDNPECNFIYSFGSVSEIQSGTANYTIPCDFLIAHQYHSRYLHFGIVFEGITYSMVNHKMVATSIPSAFLTLRNTAGGTHCWRSGQQFKGIEVAIEINYLRNQLLPFLGYPNDALQFLDENIYYTNLPDEMQALILRIEDLINSRRLTYALQTACCLEFLALLLHPDNKKSFLSGEAFVTRQIQIGKRQIRITQNDYEKIKNVHERIREDAAAFLTISDFSRKLKISEQKLKAGFQEIYQQTIWDYANTVRMNMAVTLLRSTDKNVREISQQIGYQSQAAFIRIFKKWCGITPGQFRSQIQLPGDSL